jgi:2-C-methyl-D-erythritol 2,4-cyclodiphosphate synthase
MAIGLGFDIHRLVPDRPLVLGGVEIPYSYGLMGHSDGDALLHAVTDAVLGAAGKGDIGQWFPDTDPQIEGISSRDMLQKVMEDVGQEWSVVNVDVTVVAEEPRIAPHRDAIKECIGALLATERVSVKGKTMERLGPIGNREAIAAYAVVELSERKK